MRARPGPAEVQSTRSGMPTHDHAPNVDSSSQPSVSPLGPWACRACRACQAGRQSPWPSYRLASLATGEFVDRVGGALSQAGHGWFGAGYNRTRLWLDQRCVAVGCFCPSSSSTPSRSRLLSFCLPLSLAYGAMCPLSPKYEFTYCVSPYVEPARPLGPSVPAPAKPLPQTRAPAQNLPAPAPAPTQAPWALPSPCPAA
jgi:hypothetical protein